ncbi:ATP-binding cassette domain-containing protein [Mycolicibacterium sp. 120266]|uniref:ATP-binding cassette domain-containing protein n=1 Tax=Mycolicibacterium sp. 120266 TaxID=3090601 RepID=UPI00299E6877|nr:ATP-binding cassette domain-containing protein [Mycolicibacterium sp. 120266]MDX1874499.1 ATP-binding cassette domain-containing protein [Mycolicibacterium sp. 120266]
MNTQTISRGVDVHGVTLDTRLDRVSFSAQPGTLTALIGPSGAGKSTLARVLAGLTRPESGAVHFEGTVGMVPQDDVLHGKLTVTEALAYAAELRGADPTAVADVLAELDLHPHAGTRIDTLSGGQRKRVSVALELLTGPALLILDEPTTGLDPALDRQVMTLLRRLADAGRVVIVVTHSLAFLDMCDQVLLLAPGGKTAYYGPPADIGLVLGSTDWAEIFARLCADPEGVQRHYPNAPVLARSPRPPRRQGTVGQFRTLARRQVRLLTTDRGYLTFLAALPVLVGILPLTVSGHSGFLSSALTAPLEAKQVIALTNFAAILMGTTLTVRDLAGERAIYARERAAGLSAGAYLLAKIAVFGAVAAGQATLLVLIVCIGKPAPTGATTLGSPVLELGVGVAATAVAAVILGLALSAAARTVDQVMPLLAVALTAQLVLAGGFIPVTGRPALSALASITPARWGFSASASTADLSNLVVGIAQDGHWRHTAGAWWFDMAMLGLLALAFAGIARWQLRRV